MALPTPSPIRKKAAVQRAILKRRNINRVIRVFLAYVFLVFVLENLQLAIRYNESIRKFPLAFELFRGNESFYNTEDTNQHADNISSEEEHHPVSFVEQELDAKGHPFVVQSLPINEAEKAYYRFRKDKIHPFKHDYIINASNICDESTTLIAVINSSPPNLKRREAIRQTWGSLAHGAEWPHGRKLKGKLKVVFVVGSLTQAHEKSIRDESRRRGDIVLGDFQDSYRNLTLKTLLGMRWVIDFCPDVSYYLKSDDDMIINVPYLLDIFASRPSLRRTIMGPYAPSSAVFRSGKWKLGTDVYPFKRYPPYEPGAAYTMTADIVGELFQAAEYFPQIFIDDVYITGILARALGIYHARQYGFASAPTKSPTGCDVLLDRVITGHRVFETKLLNAWDEMHRETTDSCKKRPPQPPPKRKVVPAKKAAARPRQPPPPVRQPPALRQSPRKGLPPPTKQPRLVRQPQPTRQPQQVKKGVEKATVVKRTNL